MKKILIVGTPVSQKTLILFLPLLGNILQKEKYSIRIKIYMDSLCFLEFLFSGTGNLENRFSGCSIKYCDRNMHLCLSPHPLFRRQSSF